MSDNPGYLINRFDIIDHDGFAKYVAAVIPIIVAHKGEVLVGTTSIRVLEGSSPKMNVVIKFPSEKAAMDFYTSPEYAPVIPLRLSSTTNGGAIITSGFVMPKD